MTHRIGMIASLVGTLALAATSTSATASSKSTSKKASGSSDSCSSLPDHATLQAALVAAVSTETSGRDFNMWGTIVNRDGVVCAVAFSGADRGAQWPGSRVIAAQKPTRRMPSA